MSEQQHTFGGSPLDRYVYEFEMPDPGGTGDPGLGEPEPAAEPAAEPAWQGPSQDEWGAVMGYVQAQQQREQQIAQAYGGGGQQGEQQAPDLYDDPDAWLEHKLSQRLAPVEQFYQETNLQEAEQRAMDILGDLASKDGDFDKEVARMRAEQFLPEFQSVHGNTALAAEKALEKAAHQQRQYEQQMRDKYIAEHTNHISTLSGAPGDPGTGYTVGVQQRTMPDYAGGGRVVDRFFGPQREA